MIMVENSMKMRRLVRIKGGDGDDYLYVDPLITLSPNGEINVIYSLNH